MTHQAMLYFVYLDNKNQAKDQAKLISNIYDQKESKRNY